MYGHANLLLFGASQSQDSNLSFNPHFPFVSLYLKETTGIVQEQRFISAIAQKSRSSKVWKSKNSEAIKTVGNR
jgi:hypothetical protein